MKKIAKISMVLVTVSLLGITAGKAQVIVPKIPTFSRSHPERKTRQPSPKHVWIPPEWDPYASGLHGNYMPGFWEVPPRAGLVWIPGRWQKVPKGYTWLGGHWK